MFAPVFGITHKILLNLIGVELNAKMVEIAPLTPEWELKLKRESLSRRAYGVLRFENNTLDTSAISKIVSDEPNRDDRANEVALRTGVVGKERDIQQLLNWLNANRLVEQVAYLSNKFKQTDYGEKELIQINSLIGEKLIEMDMLGKYRSGEIRESVVVNTPTAVEVPYQVDDLFLWFKSASRTEIHPVLKASVMFFELLRICPFGENHLQTSVDFFNLILSSEGYGQKKMLAVEEELFKNKEIFNKMLTESVGETGDLTVWLEYVTKEILIASEKTKTKVMNLVGDAPIFKSEAGRVISLTERQIVIMEEMTVKNEMTIREIRSLLPMVSDDTILRDLKDLMDKKLIKKKGKTKGAIYLLGKIKSFR
jgi:Fic family protein